MRQGVNYTTHTDPSKQQIYLPRFCPVIKLLLYSKENTLTQVRNLPQLYSSLQLFPGHQAVCLLHTHNHSYGCQLRKQGLCTVQGVHWMLIGSVKDNSRPYQSSYVTVCNKMGYNDFPFPECPLLELQNWFSEFMTALQSSQRVSSVHSNLLTGHPSKQWSLRVTVGSTQSDQGEL